MAKNIKVPRGRIEKTRKGPGFGNAVKHKAAIKKFPGLKQKAAKRGKASI